MFARRANRTATSDRGRHADELLRADVGLRFVSLGLLCSSASWALVAFAVADEELFKRHLLAFPEIFDYWCTLLACSFLIGIGTWVIGRMLCVSCPAGFGRDRAIGAIVAATVALLLGAVGYVVALRALSREVAISCAFAAVGMAFASEILFGTFVERFAWETGRRRISALCKWPFISLVPVVPLLVSFPWLVEYWKGEKEPVAWFLALCGWLIAALLTAWYAFVVFQARPRRIGLETPRRRIRIAAM